MAIGTLGAIALGGTALLGGVSSYMSSKAQSKAAGKAMDAQSTATMYGIDTQMEMFEKSMEQFKPFYEAGVRGISGLEGAPSGAEAPSFPSPDIAFKFDPEDQMYKIQREEGERAINRILASRGLHDSRPGINVLADFNRRLIAEETQKQYGRGVEQYGREYAGAMDKFNIENVLAQQEAGKYRDIVQMGAGAAGSMGQSALQTGQGVASQYGQMGGVQANALMRQGQAQAGMWQDIGTMPANILASYYYGQKADLW